MVNLLVICENIGKSATGIVIESFLKYLDNSKELNLIIICNQNYSDYAFKDLRLIGFEKQHVNFYYKLSLIFFGKEPGSNAWVKEGLNKLGDTKIDIIIALTSAYSIRSFQLAFEISRKKHIPYVLHALDPMPSPKAWGEHPVLRYGIKKSVRPYYKSAALISASNRQMIAYQCNQLGLNDKKTTFFYNPSNSGKDNSFQALQTLNGKKEIKFLYLGTLYDKRSPACILDALEQLYQKGFQVSFSFVGNINSVRIKELLKGYSFVKLLPFQDNPDQIISEHDILVDIDADIEDDVFISSKLNFYLAIPRPILCVTPENSPSAILVKDCGSSVIVSIHKSESIYQAIFELLKQKKIDYIDRQVLLKEVSLSMVGEKIEKTILDLVHSNA